MAAVFHLVAEAPLIAWGVYAAAVGLWTIPPIIEKAGKGVASNLPAGSGGTPTAHSASIPSLTASASSTISSLGTSSGSTLTASTASITSATLEVANIIPNQTSEVFTAPTSVISRVFCKLGFAQNTCGTFIEADPISQDLVPVQIEWLSYVQTPLQWFYRQLLVIMALLDNVRSSAFPKWPWVEMDQKYPYNPNGLLVSIPALLLAVAIMGYIRCVQRPRLRYPTIGVIIAIAVTWTFAQGFRPYCAQDLAITISVCVGVAVFHFLVPNGQIKPTLLNLAYLAISCGFDIALPTCLLGLANDYLILYTPSSLSLNDLTDYLGLPQWVEFAMAKVGNASLPDSTKLSVLAFNYTVERPLAFLLGHNISLVPGNKLYVLESIRESLSTGNETVEAPPAALKFFKSMLKPFLSLALLILAVVAVSAILRTARVRAWALSFILVGFAIHASWQSFNRQITAHANEIQSKSAHYITVPVQNKAKHIQEVVATLFSQIRAAQIRAAFKMNLSRIVYIALAAAFVLRLYLYIFPLHLIIKDFFEALIVENSECPTSATTLKALFIVIVVLLDFLGVLLWHWPRRTPHTPDMVDEHDERNDPDNGLNEGPGDGPDDSLDDGTDSGPAESLPENPGNTSKETPTEPANRPPGPSFNNEDTHGDDGSSQLESNVQSVTPKPVSIDSDDGAEDDNGNTSPLSQASEIEPTEGAAFGSSPNPRRPKFSGRPKRRSNPALEKLKVAQEIESRMEAFNKEHIPIPAGDGESLENISPRRSPSPPTSTDNRSQSAENSAQSNDGNEPSVDEPSGSDVISLDDPYADLFYTEEELAGNKVDESVTLEEGARPQEPSSSEVDLDVELDTGCLSPAIDPSISPTSSQSLYGSSHGDTSEDEQESILPGHIDDNGTETEHPLSASTDSLYNLPEYDQLEQVPTPTENSTDAEHQEQAKDLNVAETKVQHKEHDSQSFDQTTKAEGTTPMSSMAGIISASQSVRDDTDKAENQSDLLGAEVVMGTTNAREHPAEIRGLEEKPKEAGDIASPTEDGLNRNIKFDFSKFDSSSSTFVRHAGEPRQIKHMRRRKAPTIDFNFSTSSDTPQNLTPSTPAISGPSSNTPLNQPSHQPNPPSAGLFSNLVEEKKRNGGDFVIPSPSTGPPPSFPSFSNLQSNQPTLFNFHRTSSVQGKRTSSVNAEVSPTATKKPNDDDTEAQGSPNNG